MKSLVAMCCVVAAGCGSASACEPVVVQAYAPAVIVSPLAVAVAPVAVCHAPIVVQQRVVQQQVVQRQIVIRQRPRIVSQLSFSFSRVRVR